MFFGEPLPKAFFDNYDAPKKADLVIVMGTSLAVRPFAELPGLAKEGGPRLLLNNERVGDFGQRPDDVVVLSDCDSAVTQLADALGWRKEFVGGVGGG